MSQKNEHSQLSVMMVCQFFDPRLSGAANQALTLAKMLKNEGVQVKIIAGKYASEKKKETINGIEIRRLPSGNSKFKILFFLLQLCLYLWKEKKHYQIIHCHGGFIYSFAVGLIRKLSGKRSIVKITSGKSDTSWWYYGKFKRIKHKLFNFNNVFIATSKEIYNGLLKIGIPENKIHLIPNGVDTKKFCPIKAEQDKEYLKQKLNLGGKKCALFIGLLSREKGADLLIDAWLKIASTRRDLFLLCIGPLRHPFLSIEDCYEEITEKLREHKLTHTVKFVGIVNNVVDYLKTADIFTLPSRSEGLPNALLEAMACGLPCICSDIGATRDVIIDGVNGVLFKCEDSDELARSIINLLDNPDFAHRLGRAARRTIEEKFAISKIAKQYIQVYKDLVSKA